MDQIEGLDVNPRSLSTFSTFGASSIPNGQPNGTFHLPNGINKDCISLNIPRTDTNGYVNNDENIYRHKRDKSNVSIVTIGDSPPLNGNSKRKSSDQLSLRAALTPVIPPTVPRHAHSRSLVGIEDHITIIPTHGHSRSLTEQELIPNKISLPAGTKEVTLFIGPSDRRFGFSVVGGSTEGFPPRIDELAIGSPADKADLEVGDEILEVNGKSLEDATHTQVISHIHQCIRSRTICLRVKRRTGNKLAAELGASSNVQDAFVIAVEQRARERLEKLSALKKITPVDMTKLSSQLTEPGESFQNTNTTLIAQNPPSSKDVNGVLDSSPIYVTSVPNLTTPSSSSKKKHKESPNTHKSSKSSSNSSQEASRRSGHERRPETSGSKRRSRSSRTETDKSGDELELKLTERSDSQNQSVSYQRSAEHRLSKDRYSDSVKDTRYPDSIEQRLKDPYGGVNGKGLADIRSNNIDRDPKLYPDSRISKQPDRKEDPDNCTGIDRYSESGLSLGDTVDSRSEQDLEGLSDESLPATPEKTYGLDPHLDPRTEVLLDPPPSHANKKNTTSVEAESSRKSAGGEAANNRGRPSYSVGADSRSPPPSGNMLAMADFDPESTMVEFHPNNKESAVDVPVDFVGKAKTPPRYPQPKKTNNTSGRSYHNNNNYTRSSKKSRDSGSITTNGSVSSVGSVNVSQPQPPAAQSAAVTAVGMNDLIASLQRIQGVLKSNNDMSVDISAVSSLFSNPDFRNVLAVQNKVHESVCTARPPSPLCHNARKLLTECMHDLEHGASQDALDAATILSSPNLECLLTAHDTISNRYTVSFDEVKQKETALDSYRLKDPPQLDPVVRVQPPQATYLEDEKFVLVRIDKTNEPLGATIRNEDDAVIIGRIVKGGAAEKSGRLHEGDEILKINGQDVRGKSVNDVCDMLAGMSGTLTFTVVPNHMSDSEANLQQPLHLKAHFNYDPEEDPYIPCRELGMSFEKGDILNVIDQSDPNWWQAYRDGEDRGLSLAGLIPSISFQQQREAMRQTVVEDTVTKEKNKKQTLLCAKPQKKKKKKMYANFSEDSEEILTYEEVGILYPNTNIYPKRPIVLIGPLNIGRHELRQKLLENTDEFAAAVPHTSRPKKDHEVEGVDSYFVTRPQFESMILSRQFVEHGEYERQYYGTSIKAIQDVRNQKKFCVLNLHPTSLEAMRATNLMPYVVFIAPPALEKLRHRTNTHGHPLKDDELKDIIEKARDMEDHFGHYFDEVIINQDFDRTFAILLEHIRNIERHQQWVPAAWLRRGDH